jgi:hypothetical protein
MQGQSKGCFVSASHSVRQLGLAVLRHGCIPCRPYSSQKAVILEAKTLEEKPYTCDRMDLEVKGLELFWHPDAANDNGIPPAPSSVRNLLRVDPSRPLEGGTLHVHHYAADDLWCKP